MSWRAETIGSVKRTSENQRVTEIIGILSGCYPDVKTQLDHGDAFQLLVATILSAQCTDRQVNRVTPGLFRKFPNPQAFADADPTLLENLVRPTGYFRSKARHIRECARAIIGQYGGRVPDSLDALIKLPGVGRKTANVVLGAAFGQQTIVVDTHVKRIARRLGLTGSADPGRIEQDLMKVIPKAAWSAFSLQLIYLGREYCIARKPRCAVCPLNALCPSAIRPEESPEKLDGRDDA